MYRISILTDHTATGQEYVRQVRHFCMKQGMFPRIELYVNEENFFEQLIKSPPMCIILALPGVAGLNAAEHIRSLVSDCGLIWCCDLDFSLHAFKLRADYFILLPISEEQLREGLAVWTENRKRRDSMSLHRDIQEFEKELVH